MSGLPPGFIDDVPDPLPSPARLKAGPAEGPDQTRPLGPMLLPITDGPGVSRIDPTWEPALLLARRHKGVAPFLWLLGGMGVIIGGWIVLSLIGFVEDEFRRGWGLGVPAVLLFASGLALCALGLYGELRSYRKLQRVDRLRALLGHDGSKPEEILSLCRVWLASLEGQFPAAKDLIKQLEQCDTYSGVRTRLESQLLVQMRGLANKAGRRAAIEGAALIAVTPSPILEGVIAAIRGVVLIRQVAEIFGIRPGLLATFALLRHVAWTASGVSGLDMLSQSMADEALHKLPWIKHIAGAVPGTSLAAIRLYRLAGITAEACSPCTVPKL
jgi:putative membrane protein